MMRQSDDERMVVQALAAYDVGQLKRFIFHAGTAARTWRVLTDVGEFLLRTRGSRTSSSEAIRFDHELRRHILHHGIPTALPIQTRDDATYVRVGECALELYTIVPGQTLKQAGDGDVTAAARMLAEFHRATVNFPMARDLPPVAQYQTLGLDTQTSRMESPALLTTIYAGLADAAVSAGYDAHLQLAMRWLDRLRGEFSDDVYGSLSHTVTHGDYTLANILYDGGRITGVFDFDWSRWAPRIRDVADGLYFIAGQRRTVLSPADIWSLTEAVQLDVERAGLWLQSYHAHYPLSSRELACVPLALAARWLSVRVEGMIKVPRGERLCFVFGCIAEPLEWLEENEERVFR